MEKEEVSKSKNIELTTWVIGMVGILIVIISQSKTALSGFMPVTFYPYLLIVSMLLMSTSLFLKLKRESKKKHFSIFMYTREILRTVAGLGIAFYYLTII